MKMCIRDRGGNLNRMGYISEVKSLISELTQYNVSPEKLDTFLETEDVGETLRLKMQDISVMYHSFSEYLQGQYITLSLIHILRLQVKR